MATGFPVKANYATGDVLTAANMNDLSGTLNYLQYLPPRNAVLNSNFSCWQRGTSLAISNGATTYLADRWAAYRGATGSTVSRQATNDTTNLPNIQYCARVQRDSGNTSTSAISYYNIFESVNSIPFAGKTVTFSFYARAGANYSQASSGLTVVVKTGTGTDQNVYSGFTGASNVILQTATLTTTWQRFTYSATLATTATQIATGFEFTPVGTAGAADYFEITGVQLELGSTANTYMPNQPTYQGELAACQRYYWRNIVNTASYEFISAGACSYLTSQANIPLVCPVPMRVWPTSIDTSGIAVNRMSTDTRYTGGSFTLDSITASNIQTIYVKYTHTSGVFTLGENTYLQTNNTSNAYIGLSAEL